MNIEVAIRGLAEAFTGSRPKHTTNGWPTEGTRHVLWYDDSPQTIPGEVAADSLFQPCAKLVRRAYVLEPSFTFSTRRRVKHMTAVFHHIGVPTSAKGKAETYIEGGKVFITDPEASPYRIEFLRFEADTPMPELLQRQCHAAFMVDNIATELEGRDVVVEPFDATDELTVAFIKVGDALIELMETKK